MSALGAPDLDAAEPLFVPDGDRWVPTGSSRGPWDPASLHGGPVAALVVRELERVSAPIPARLARVTVELLRPVPLEPLEISWQVVRPGAKVGLVEVELRRAAGGERLVLARGLRIRTAEVDFPVTEDPDVPALPAHPSLSAGMRYPDGLHAFHSHAVEHRFASGAFGEVGPMFDWTRLVVQVVPGEQPSPWQRVAASADFGNGLSALVPFGEGLFINPDLTIHLWREPVDDWVGLDAVTRASDSGIGMAESALWDSRGRIGRSVQSLLLDRF